ncbi:MAG: allantoate amidohydrolase [Betaproteobacteria bacterium]|nr:allantoate amidohydrolase [Betaproteobacteria bacterium]
MIDAARILERCDALAHCTELAGGLTRMYLSKAHRQASQLALAWMREAGMSARMDAAGNVVGRYEAASPGARCLMLGSHLDTVRDAGIFDGMLGVVTAIECVAALRASGRRLEHAVEVLGFADEEGVRFGATLLGSRAVAGTFDRAALELRDDTGTTMREAMKAFGLDPEALAQAARRREEVLAYVELHIEQGPVLEAENLPVGVVTAINGFTRLSVRLRGEAGHAGTVPMALRRDAFAAAAESAIAVERIAKSDADLVATIGRIKVQPGAINVIPGEAEFTVDLRSPIDSKRENACAALVEEIGSVAKRRRVDLHVERLQDHGATPCAAWVVNQIGRAVAAEGLPVRRLASGAGHDGIAMRAIADVGMLFVRCKGGVSHSPAESITEADAGTGARILLRFIEHFSPGTT